MGNRNVFPLSHPDLVLKPVGLAQVDNLRVQTTAIPSAAETCSLTCDAIVLTDANGEIIIYGPQSIAFDGAIVGLGGMDAAVMSASGWYYLFLIGNEFNRELHGLISSSRTAPTLPAGFTHWAMVSAVRYDSGTGFIETFTQVGAWVMRDQVAIFTARAGVAAWAQLAGAEQTAFEAAVPPPPAAQSCWIIGGPSASTDTGQKVAAHVTGGVAYGERYLHTATSGLLHDGFYAETTIEQPLYDHNIWVQAETTDLLTLLVTGFRLML